MHPARLASIVQSGKRFTPTVPPGASTPPNWTAATVALPGFVLGTQRVGFPQQLDFGTAANSPTNWDYQMILNATDIPGAYGLNVTSAPAYTPLSTGELSYRLTARNAAGSATTTVASITIDA